MNITEVVNPCVSDRGANAVRKISGMYEIADGEELSVKCFDTMLSCYVYKAKVKEYKYLVENKGGNTTVCYATIDAGEIMWYSQFISICLRYKFSVVLCLECKNIL